MKEWKHNHINVL